MNDATNPPKPALRWAGVAFSALATVMVSGSAALKLTGNPKLVDMLSQHLGFPTSVVPTIGALELLCIILYAVPFTAPLGAVLLTGYFGGAICAHLRVEEPSVAPFVIASLAWAGLALRNPKILGLFGRD
jgi:hypothetical protein